MSLCSKSIIFVMLSISWALELDVKVSLTVQGGSQEYTYYIEKITWNEASKFCEGTGGSLAKIDSEDFQHRLINAFEAAYGSNPFSEDYWTGLFQPARREFRWASDCAEAYYTPHINNEWDSGKYCIKFHKYYHSGYRDACSSKNAFICERPLPLGYSCGMSEVFSAKYLGTDILNLNACETTCDADSDCWMVMFTPPYGCVKVAYSTVELVAGIETDNSLLRVKGKFCIEVSIVTESISPPEGDSRDTPIINCSASSVTPSEETTLTLLKVSPTTTQVSSLTQSIATAFVENFYVTSNCFTSTMTDLPATPYSPGYSTVNVVMSCINSPCFCMATITPSSLGVDPVQLAEELSQNLTIDEKSTSAYKRKLTSARDNRTSSMTMGYLGICFVSVPLGIIVLLDIKKMVSDFMRNRLQQSDTESLYELVCRSNK